MPAVPRSFPRCRRHLNWDLWLGPAKERPYSPAYCPYNWRFWWDFGTAETGNWGCHILDIPFWALKLKYPTRVDLDEVPNPADIDPQRTPKGMKTRLEFPAEEGHGKLALHWWHGSSKEVFEKYKRQRRRQYALRRHQGTITADFNRHSTKMNDGSEPAKVEETIAASPGFHKGMDRRLQRRPARIVRFRRLHRSAGRSRVAGQRRLPAPAAGSTGTPRSSRPPATRKSTITFFPDFREGWKV